MLVNCKISPFNNQECINHSEKLYKDLKIEKQNIIISYNGKTLSLAHSWDVMTRLEGLVLLKK